MAGQRSNHKMLTNSQAIRLPQRVFQVIPKGNDRIEQLSESEINELHKQAYDKSCQELFKRQLSNNENFDKSILTLASGGLALTITFVGNLKSVHWISLLLLCWAAFFLAIVSTIVSYIASQLGIAKQLKLLRRYHHERDDLAQSERNRAAELNEHLSYVSLAGFIIGVLLLLTFFGFNATTENLGKAMPVALPPTQVGISTTIQPQAPIPQAPTTQP